MIFDLVVAFFDLYGGVDLRIERSHGHKRRNFGIITFLLNFRLVELQRLELRLNSFIGRCAFAKLAVFHL